VLDARLGQRVHDGVDPVTADVPAIDVTFIDETNPRANPIGVKGSGELGPDRPFLTL
jgi:CO/xanthine dehydrogenase Mo-binding subunit